MKSIKKKRKLSNLKKNINKSIKRNQKGGDYYQDNLKQIIDSNPVKNYSLTFLPNNSLNFDVTFKNENLDTYVDNRCKEFFPLMEPSEKIEFNNINIISFLSSKENCELFDNTDFLNSEITRNKYKIVDNYRIVENTDNESYIFPYDVLYIFRIIHLLKREIKSNNVFLDNLQLVKGSDAIISYTYVCNIYSKVLQDVKNKKPDVTNDNLTRLLFLLNASGERILMFFQLGMINIIRENMENIGVLTFSGANNYNINLLNYIKIYEQGINYVFNINPNEEGIDKINNINKSINDYVNNVFQHFIKIVNNEIIVTTYSTYFLLFSLNESLQGKTTRKDQILMGIAIDKIETNINENIMTDSFKYRWTLNEKTKKQLNKYNIKNLIPFYYKIPVVHSGKMLTLQRIASKNKIASIGLNIFSKKGGKKREQKQNKTRKNKKNNYII